MVLSYLASKRRRRDQIDEMHVFRIAMHGNKKEFNKATRS